MSIVVTVAAAGTVAVGGKIFAGLAAAAATSLGMRMVENAQQQTERERQSALVTDQMQQTLDVSQVVEVSIATEAALEDVVAERCALTFADDQITLSVTRDIRGKVTVTAHGRGVSRAAVTQRAEEMLGRIRQQVAYREVVQKMKQHGFAVGEEARANDGTVRLQLRRKR